MFRRYGGMLPLVYLAVNPARGVGQLVNAGYSDQSGNPRFAGDVAVGTVDHIIVKDRHIAHIGGKMNFIIVFDDFIHALRDQARGRIAA